MDAGNPAGRLAEEASTLLADHLKLAMRTVDFSCPSITISDFV